MKKTLFTALILTNAFISLGQLPINIKFRVTDDAKNIMKGMTIRLYEQNQVIEEIEKSKSVVDFTLNAEAIYTIEVELDGFVTKRVSVNTDAIPSDMRKDSYRFNIALERSRDYRLVQNAEEVLEYPSAILHYDTTSGVIDYNETYWNSTKAAYEKLFESPREIKF